MQRVFSLSQIKVLLTDSPALLHNCRHFSINCTQYIRANGVSSSMGPTPLFLPAPGGGCTHTPQVTPSTSLQQSQATFQLRWGAHPSSPHNQSAFGTNQAHWHQVFTFAPNYSQSSLKATNPLKWARHQVPGIKGVIAGRAGTVPLRPKGRKGLFKRDAGK